MTKQEQKDLKELTKAVYEVQGTMKSLDERTESIIREFESLNTTLEKITIVTYSNKGWISSFKWIIGLGATLIAACLTKMQDWW